MNSPYQSVFTKSLLTAVFAGIFTTVICVIFDVVYRQETGFPYHELINVSTLIFSVNILFAIIGLIYYFFIKYMKRGEIFYIIFCVVITLYLILLVSESHRSDTPLWNKEFHELLDAMIIIMGLAAAVGVPVLYHSKRFEKEVL